MLWKLNKEKKMKGDLQKNQDSKKRDKLKWLKRPNKLNKRDKQNLKSKKKFD